MRFTRFAGDTFQIVHVRCSSDGRAVDAERVQLCALRASLVVHDEKL